MTRPVPGAVHGRPPKLSPETVQALRVWAAVGTSMAQAARNVGVSTSTLRRYLRAQHKTRAVR